MDKEEILRRLKKLYESYDPDNVLDFAVDAVEEIHEILKQCL